jgi:hypothetical protein
LVRVSISFRITVGIMPRMPPPSIARIFIIVYLSTYMITAVINLLKRHKLGLINCTVS